MCHCNDSPISGSGAAPSFESLPGSTQETAPSPTVEVKVETPVVAPVENVVPIPVHPPRPMVPRTVVESSTTLQSILEEEGETKDRIIWVWQGRGAIGSNRVPRDYHPYRKALGQRHPNYSCWLGVEQELRSKLRRAHRGNDSGAARDSESGSKGLSDAERDEGSDANAKLDSGELQLVFPISQMEFDSLLSGEIEAEVHLVVEQEVVCSGAQDDELEYFEE
ncbi:hypothetical protein BDM02DRAFT_3132960 [Thelephora ganbajun]|uniref:Uncharacterized protein n=1 Tax=Thelephora ganbajun TaxID=370292 RepID=A0ACB6YZR1_THEGA|nr:hypothetical protein BDM02DRAFT_3132960 [Thelephora ganbajun]